MFFDIGGSELLLIGAVALVAIGPKELPRALCQIGKWSRQARQFADVARSQVDQLMREAEIAEIGKAVAPPPAFDLNHFVSERMFSSDSPPALVAHEHSADETVSPSLFAAGDPSTPTGERAVVSPPDESKPAAG